MSCYIAEQIESSTAANTWREKYIYTRERFLFENFTWRINGQLSQHKQTEMQSFPEICGQNV